MTASGITDINQSSLKFLNIEGIITKSIKLKDLIEKVNTVQQKAVVGNP